MNRISAKIPSSKIKFSKSISKFDYRMLMNFDCDFSVSPESQVVKSYDYWNARQSLFNIEEDKHQKQEDIYMYQQIRQRIIEECKDKDIDYIVNTLVAYLYTVRNVSSKKTLWACFGDVIVENLKKNLEGKGRVCRMCGKRFIPDKFHPNAICCSKECTRLLDNKNRTLRRFAFELKS